MSQTTDQLREELREIRQLLGPYAARRRGHAGTYSTSESILASQVIRLASVVERIMWGEEAATIDSEEAP